MFLMLDGGSAQIVASDGLAGIIAAFLPIGARLGRAPNGACIFVERAFDDRFIVAFCAWNYALRIANLGA